MSRLVSIFKAYKEYIKSLISRSAEIRIEKMMLDNGCVLKRPFSIMNMANLILESPIHIEYGATFYLRHKLFIGSGTIIGPRCTVHTDNHNYNGNSLPYDSDMIGEDIKIGKNVWIGDNVTLLPGCKIGDGAVIGAGAVIAKEIPNLAIVVGNPAKIIKYRDETQYNKLINDNRIYLKEKMVSVIIPAHNRACRLKQMINSILNRGGRNCYS